MGPSFWTIDQHADRIFELWQNGNRKAVIEELEVAHPLFAAAVCAHIAAMHGPSDAGFVSGFVARLASEAAKRRTDTPVEKEGD